MIASTASTVTYLFSDIEGSTRLWEVDPVRAAHTLAWHDETTRSAVTGHRGTVVKKTGDGVHAVFDEAADALAAVIDLQLALVEKRPELARLALRCGLHLGSDQRRDNDFYGQAVNRAARIMSAAHGGQVLLSRAVVERLGERLPEGVALRDLGLVRLRDLGTPEHLFQLVHPALRRDFPPLRSMASTPNNLAQQLNSFVGRDRDMEQVQQLLANSRLLTLLGMGGLGKSRLSVQVAAVVLDSYQDGVWFVELAALTDPKLVPQAVANVVGVKEEPGGSLMDALHAFVADRQLLFVLDNCEHVVQACAELAKRLLQAGPGVRVLASSRDALHIAGENVFPVAPLPAPAKGGAPSVESLMSVDSVRLFVDRARAVQPNLHLNEAAVRSVAEICRRLDGIPLALELAAARVRSMTIEQIAARLDDRFRLLNRGDRTALPRQQTLRALIDWSYDLLDAKERALFQRLSVFAGGCTLEAAEAVCAGGELATVEVVDALADLVEKSLVALEPERSRYRMLDTVRQYAQERLAACGGEAAVRARHLDHFLALAEELALDFRGPRQSVALETLDQERDNLVAAFRHCTQREDGAEPACRLVLALKQYFFARGLFDLGYQASVEASAIPTPTPATELRCKVLWAAGQIGSYTGRYEEAQALLLASRDIAVQRDDRRMIVNVENYLALASLGLGDRQGARMHCSEALRLAREVGSPIEISVAANALAQVQRIDGRLDEAEALYEEVVALSRVDGASDFVALGVLGLAMVAIGRGHAARARELLREALSIVEQTGSRPAAQSVLEVAAGLAAQEGDFARCARVYGAAEAHMALTGIRRDPADQAFLEPLIGEARRALGEAKFEPAQLQGGTLPLAEALRDVQVWLDTATPV